MLELSNTVTDKKSESYDDVAAVGDVSEEGAGFAPRHFVEKRPLRRCLLVDVKQAGRLLVRPLFVEQAYDAQDLEKEKN